MAKILNIDDIISELAKLRLLLISARDENKKIQMLDRSRSDDGEWHTCSLDDLIENIPDFLTSAFSADDEHTVGSQFRLVPKQVTANAYGSAERFCLRHKGSPTVVLSPLRIHVTYEGANVRIISLFVASSTSSAKMMEVGAHDLVTGWEWTRDGLIWNDFTSD